MRKRLALGGVLAMAMGAALVQAQQKPAAPDDPRIGLKPGHTDAGVAAWNIELVSNLPKPPGFFNPKAPAGSVTPPERPEGAPAPPPPDPNAPPPVGSGFTNSDLAFKGMHAVVGNYHGFNTYDVENAKPAEAGGVDRLPGRPGRRVDLRQPAVHVGGADARPARLRRAGRDHAGQRRALPRHPHLRHQQPEEPQAGGGDPDLPRLAHPHAGAGQERPRQHLSLRLGDQHRAVG